MILPQESAWRKMSRGPRLELWDKKRGQNKETKAPENERLREEAGEPGMTPIPKEDFQEEIANTFRGHSRVR